MQWLCVSKRLSHKRVYICKVMLKICKKHNKFKYKFQSMPLFLQNTNRMNYEIHTLASENSWHLFSFRLNFAYKASTHQNVLNLLSYYSYCYHIAKKKMKRNLCSGDAHDMNSYINSSALSFIIVLMNSKLKEQNVLYIYTIKCIILGFNAYRIMEWVCCWQQSYEIIQNV